MSSTAADHRAIAFKLESQRGTEFLVHVYPSSQSGQAVARGICTGKYPSYQPAGAFQAIASQHDDGTAVWARYVDGLDLPPIAREMTVRVPDYGTQPGYEGVRLVEVTISARCPRCGGPRGAVRKDHFVRDGARMVRDAWHNGCGHQDDYQAVLAEAARRAKQVTKTAEPQPRGGEIEPVQGGRYEKAVRLIVEALKAAPWARVRVAARLLEENGEREAADAVRQFIGASATRNNTSARAVARYLVHLDSNAAADTSTGGQK
ncbi:hypothetical protein DI272_19265 [Streptomyces sp. Act143]|uniref:hypothetical protein n=1 Tax=Streptomyces sp. Act143 TaxID=2200760 RepID=UPI000D673B4B|nr:hypothetical protein [Streptomyces sp. Act143]PWI16070.1 hypothetical protein DI272_19265 [Streptomyces sp. Act143]